ncbi:MAG: RHS repeat-associated core domain-containing protein, partial [Bacteroidales bacterium]|nr:RHS repeat-associated core domain-containing protein [Bacteroidales bacterium]
MTILQTYRSTSNTSVKTPVFEGERCLLECCFYPLFWSCDFTGKEKDEETGFGYFGARYMDHDQMTMWLSVDPMADKYPGLSPYAYCAWNPVKLVDPDGNEIVLSDLSKELQERLCKCLGCITGLTSRVNNNGRLV